MPQPPSIEDFNSMNTTRRMFLFSVSAIAEVYKNEGNEEYRTGDFINAIHFYTEGIKVKCRNEELKAKLYSNRATAHFKLGKSGLGSLISRYFFISSSFSSLLVNLLFLLEMNIRMSVYEDIVPASVPLFRITRTEMKFSV